MDHRIEADGSQFIIVDGTGETVGVYPTEVAAKEEFERFKCEQAMWTAAQLLIDTAIKAHMQMHGVDHETARHWVRIAAETAK